MQKMTSSLKGRDYAKGQGFMYSQLDIKGLALRGPKDFSGITSIFLIVKVYF